MERTHSQFPVFLGLLSLFLLPAILPADEAAKPFAESQPADSLIELLDKLQADPALLGAVKEKLAKQAEELRDAAQKGQPQIEKDSGDLESRSKKIDELKKQMEELDARIGSALSAIKELQAGLDAAKTGAQNREEVSKKLQAIETALGILKSLHPEPAPTSPSKPLADAEPVHFSRDIRPILAKNCFACHGPDEHQRKAGLRLDDEEVAFKALKSGHIPLVGGDRAKSELWHRITTTDVADRMPPADYGKTLTEKDVDYLGRWIDQGAKYEKHWAFVKPERPAVPEVSNKSWPKNPIDQFILARLEKEGLEPSPEADRRALIRRVTYDLTGLPPTPKEVEDFVNDAAPDAYEKVVDRLLASPRYGEHQGRIWLDSARYADTNGYHIDNERYMWRWRDWVIDAFNRNEPFDQFTIDQLAGDLLPNPTLEQRIGSGFNRNHMINFEGGAIPDEYRTNYVIDRVNTTGQVWLGLTVGCGQCHDHKYDPITQKEFYQLFAFFNSVPEEGLDGREGNSNPVIKAPYPDQAVQVAAYQARVDGLKSQMERPMPLMDALQGAWEKKRLDGLQSRWTTLKADEAKTSGGATFKPLEDGSYLAGGANPDKDFYTFTAKTSLNKISAIRLDALTDPSLPNGGAGRSENSNFVLGEIEAEIAPAANPEAFEKLAFSDAFADFSQDKFDPGKAIDGKADTGWGVQGFDRRENRTALFLVKPTAAAEGEKIIRIRLRFETSFARHAIGRFKLSLTADPSLAHVELDPWYVNGPFQATDGNTAYTKAYPPETAPVNIAETYEDGRVKWLPRTDWDDGKAHELQGENCATYLYRVIVAPTARQMSIALGSDDAVKVWLNGHVVVDQNVKRGLSPDQDRAKIELLEGENQILMKVVNYGGSSAFVFRKTEEQILDLPLELERVLLTPKDKRSADQAQRLRAQYRRERWPEWKPLEDALAQATNERNDYEKQIPTTMVMKQMEKPRDTFLLTRGQYDQPADKVEPKLPSAFPPLPEGANADRLGLAKWLVDPNHPLTARVTVNRFWQQFFGTGIVKTTEDFGTQGEWPTHPELLDWLATEFIRIGWDVKAFERMIVTSATYRQSSRIRPELKSRDPENRLIARGPRFRMDAEMVRDTALDISGLLVEKIGGPSVKPYQPPGLWEEVAYGGKEFTAQTFEQDHGEKLYRRSMYTFWKRQAPPPSMIVFDAPSREICMVRRSRTNTPLQALTLMNDPQYVEASRALAQRMMTEAGPAPEARVTFAFELATARKPTEKECAILMNVYSKECEKFRADADAAAKLLAVGESKRDDKLDAAELAAWTCVANMILNLDETVTKG